MTPLPCTLELLRARDADDPWAFVPEPQEYLLRHPAGDYRSAHFDWSAQTLQDIGQLRHPSPDREALARLGHRMRAFLEAAGWAAREAEIEAALRIGRSVHLSIRSAAAELYALPWELLPLRSDQPLGATPGLLLRYEWPATSTRPNVRTRRGGTLLAASSSGGPIPFAEHRRVVAPGSTLPDANGKALAGALRADDIAVLHVLCHGRAVSSGTFTAGLALGEGETLDGTALAATLGPYAGTVRLIVLGTCWSGDAGDVGSHLGGVAQSLHRAGFAAVVGSRLPLSQAGSITLAERLHAGLRGGTLEEAFLAAREALRLDPGAGPFDWASLQLYARAADGDATRPLDPPPRPPGLRPRIAAAALTLPAAWAWTGSDNVAEHVARAWAARAVQPPVAAHDVVVVGFDVEDPRALRATHPELVRRLVDGGARVIAFDVRMVTETPDDPALADAIREATARHVPVVVGGGPEVAPLLAPVVRVASLAGATYPWDVVAGVPVSGEPWPLAVAALCGVLGRPDGPDCVAHLDGEILQLESTTNAARGGVLYLPPVERVPAFAYDATELAVANKAVFVGTVRAGEDTRATPWGVRHGVEIHAAMYQALLRQRALRLADPRADVVLTMVTAGASLALVRVALRRVAAAIVAAAFVATVIVLGAALGVWVAIVPPLAACALAAGALTTRKIR